MRANRARSASTSSRSTERRRRLHRGPRSRMDGIAASLLRIPVSARRVAGGRARLWRRCTPDFFGFDAPLGLRYRGRFDASGNEPVADARRKLYEAMRLVAVGHSRGRHSFRASAVRSSGSRRRHERGSAGPMRRAASGCRSGAVLLRGHSHGLDPVTRCAAAGLVRKPGPGHWFGSGRSRVKRSEARRSDGALANGVLGEVREERRHASWNS